MSDKHYVGLDITGFEDNGKTRPVSRVTLRLDEDNVITSGDDTGSELIADCAHGTQEMADAILARIKGYQYQMFSADAANLDPAAELGDGVTVGGVYGVVSRLSDDGNGYPSITAPGETELEDEFPTGGGPLTREFNRQISKTRSQIIKTASSIRQEVTAELEGMSSSFEVSLDGITARVESVEKKSEEDLANYAKTVTAALGDLQSQIDGAIMTWFYEYEPTVKNYPANSWSTEDEKIKHLGDVFYIVDNPEKGGLAYRWVYTNGIYSWSLIEDVELAKALADAAKAQDTADKKRRVFTSQPATPYDVGDLWVGGPSGDIWRCIKARESGIYVPSDWGLASKYTDNTYAEQRASEINQRIDSIRLSVSNGNGESTLTLKVGDTQLSSEKITFTGFVTFESLENSGETNINGDNLTTGLIQDKQKRNQWNLDTGALVTNSMTANEINANGLFRAADDYYGRAIELASGQMVGFYNKSGFYEQVGYVDYSAWMRDINTNEIYYGIQMQAEGVIRISSPIISVSDSPSIEVTTSHGFTGEINKNFVASNGNTAMLHLQFINGFCVNAY